MYIIESKYLGPVIIKNKVKIVVILPYLVIILAWQFLPSIFKLEDYILPSFSQTIMSFIHNYHVLLSNSLITGVEALTGLILAFVVSIVIGCLIGYYSWLYSLFYPLILVWQIVPLISIAPLLVVLLGFSVKAKILIVFLSLLFPCLISFIRGINNIDSEVIYLMRTMGASELMIFRLVKLPNSLLSLFTGLKISVTYSVTSAVIAEYLGAERGLGVYISRMIASFNTPQLFASILCIIIITLLLYMLVKLIEVIFYYKMQS